MGLSEKVRQRGGEIENETQVRKDGEKKLQLVENIVI